MMPRGVTIGPGQGGLERVSVDRDECRAELYLFGANLTAWQPEGQRPVLWTSPTSAFSTSAAIRGGVPICFPWFGPRAGEAQHGFARTAAWRFEGATESPDGVALELAFDATDATLARWPHRFSARYRVGLGRRLELALEVTNSGDFEWTYEAALHAYFSVEDARHTTIGGLEGLSYLDKTKAGAERRLEGRLTFDRETDAVFLDHRDGVEIADGARRISIQKDGSMTTVVWNPWSTKAAGMKDVGDGWTRFVCVEPANAGRDVVRLSPGQSHVLRARVAVNG